MALGFGIAESAFDIFGKSFCKFLNFIFWAKGVIRRDAGLPAVQSLAPGNLLDMLLDVYAGEQNRGGLSAKLKCDAGVVLGCHFCNVCADLRTPRKEYMVKREF